MRDHVDVAEELKGFDERQRPPELTSLTEDYADVLRVLRAVLIWDLTVNEDLARCRFEDARHDLYGR